MAGGKVSILVDPDLTGFPGKLRAGLSGATGAAGLAGRAIGTALAGGTAVAAIGFKKVLDIGIEFQSSLNTLQAVTKATDAQMKAVSSTATTLGNDLSLPATSAADAAAAMTELAKGGLTVEQAMTAAKGTLQLAAAAHIDAAQAAEIQANALNVFGLSADQAGHVADVLANTANAASGEITDMAAALQAGGSVAAQFGISVDDTATAIGVFAKNGIQGSDAGTLLKSTLLALASPSKQAATALQTLGVDAFDAQGKFVGLPVIFDQLQQAQQRMTPEAYAAATSIAFGSDAARAAGIAAREGGAGFLDMAGKVRQAGGAAEAAAAKSKGLGGALEGFKSQLETIAITIFGKVSPGLEKFVRDGAEGLPKLAEGAGKLFTQLKPVGDGFGAVFTALKPIATGIASVVTAGSGLGPVGVAATVFGGALKVAAAIITPFAAAAGALLKIFGALPGPIQAAVSALLLFKVGPALLAGLFGGLRKTNTEAAGAGRSMGLLGRTFSTVTAPVGKVVSGLTTGTKAIKSFGDQMKLQQQLALGFGHNLTKLEAAQSAFLTSTNKTVVGVRNFTTTVGQIKAGAAGAGAPITTLAASMRALGEQSGNLGKIGSAFTTAAAGATRFKTLAGGAAAVGTTVKVGLSSLTSFLGGPWGVALAAGGVALSLLGQHQEEAAAKAAAHQQALEGLRGTLDTLSGSVTDATEKQKAQELAADGTLKAVQALGIAVDDYTQASLGNAPVLASVNAQLAAQEKAAISSSLAWKLNSTQLEAAGISLDTLASAAIGAPEGLQKVSDAITRAGGASSSAGKELQALVDHFRESSDAAVTLGQKMNLSAKDMATLAEQQKLAAEASKDFATRLESIKPGLATLKDGAKPIGQVKVALDQMGAAALKSATSAGKSSAALYGNAVGAEAARAKMVELRAQFVQAAEGAGLTEQRANELADSLGLIPDKVATTFQTNAPQVQAEVDKIRAAILATPDKKSIVIDAPSQEVQAALRGLGATIETIPNSKQVRITLDDAGARAKGEQLKTLLNGITGMAKVDANIAPGTAKGDQLKRYIDGLTGIMTDDGNIKPGVDKANQLKTFVDGIIGIITEDGNNAEGKAKADELKAYADALRAQLQIDADVSAAKAAIDSFVKSQQGRSVTIAIKASGGIGTVGRAFGGVDVKGYAAGGATSLRKMSNLRADVVRPGQLRVIGDNMRFPEFFIPADRNSRRSRALLEQLMRTMGYIGSYRAYADGGVAVSGSGRDIVLTRLINELGALSLASRGSGAVAAATRAGDLIVNQQILPRSEVSSSAIARDSVRKIRHARFTGGLGK